MEGYWKDTPVPYELSDLSQSIFATLGLSGCSDLLGLGANPGERECLMLVDGLGKNAIDTYGSQFPHLHSLRYHATLHATFPSTTATSLTSLGTGKKAGEHGMVGYTMRVPNSGTPERLLNALKWDERVDPQIWQPHQTLFERASAAEISVTSVGAKRFENTGFTRAALRGGEYRGANSAAELLDHTVSSLSRERSFVYLYLNDVDEASHGEGFGSGKFLAALAKVDSLIGELKAKLPGGARLWVSSDHGMINRGDYCVLGKGNELLDGVDLLGGEPRVRYLYCATEKIPAIRSRWESFFGAKVTIYSREEAISAKLFGERVLPANLDRIGDLIVVAHERLILIEPEREALQIAMVGHHGGVSAEEIEIPLLTNA